MMKQLDIMLSAAGKRFQKSDVPQMQPDSSPKTLFFPVLSPLFIYPIESNPISDSKGSVYMSPRLKSDSHVLLHVCYMYSEQNIST